MEIEAAGRDSRNSASQNHPQYRRLEHGLKWRLAGGVGVGTRWRRGLPGSQGRPSAGAEPLSEAGPSPRLHAGDVLLGHLSPLHQALKYEHRPLLYGVGPSCSPGSRSWTHVRYSGTTPASATRPASRPGGMNVRPCAAAETDGLFRKPVV